MTEDPPAPRRAVLVVNPVAGRGRALRLSAPVADVLRGHGWSVQVVVSRDEDHATATAAAAGADQVVVSLGGDGLHRLLALGCLDGGAALAPLPGGRGNDLVRALGLPTDPLAAARALGRPGERRLDVGEVDGRPFLGVATVGIEGAAGRHANSARLLRGSSVYVWGAVRALVEHRPVPLRVTVDGVGADLLLHGLSVGQSGRHGGGIRACPDAELDDGLLDVTALQACSVPRLVALLLRAFGGDHVRDPWVSTGRGRVVRVEGPPLTVHADGEHVGVLPATVTVRPAALRVLVPRG
ncbi:diacylglycerol/lipid kinase family protein [Arsenicicoccus dermatophilus]|uniref:diacylglycerol/lipid kinase family protein n=1 Tax=Arsenicicoccus dermatophilus TaxID=1076331 RepID=UPI001F4C5401|nr:diacylglycerol kinase family protein [Arsenicicoccus dermatophilus]MCH8613280.1 diacylglycerol kinase family lipid kinase [Arsenicicoccus dermatophilus]